MYLHNKTSLILTKEWALARPYFDYIFTGQTIPAEVVSTAPIPVSKLPTDLIIKIGGRQVAKTHTFYLVGFKNKALRDKMHSSNFQLQLS